MSETATASGNPTLIESLLARVMRAYPLASGCGSIANSTALGRMAGYRRVNLWARVAGAKALVPLDDFVGRAMYFFGELDPKITRALRRVLRPGDVALDIGANLGLVSLQMARMVGPGGAVHAFEPNPTMQAYLSATLAANPNLPIRLHRFALGREEGELPLMIPTGNAGAASLVDSGGSFATEPVTVQIRQLDTVCAQIGIDRIGAIKMDVEGFEAQVLEGGRTTIERMRPRLILLEENGFHPQGPRPHSFRLLQEMGYEVQALPRTLMRVHSLPLDRLGGRPAHDFLAVRRRLP